MRAAFLPLLLLVARAPPAAGEDRVEPSIDLQLPDPPLVIEQAVDLDLRLEHASHDVPAGAPNVVVHAPPGLELDSVGLVVYLHGWECCARAIVYDGPVACKEGDTEFLGWGLGQQLDASGVNSVLVVPQLEWVARSGNPGAFAREGFAGAWLAELTEGVLEPRLGVENIDSVTIVAHSGGYVTALALLERAGTWPIRDVVMLDALYGGHDRLARWVTAEPGRRAMSLHTPYPTTTSQSRLLAQRVRRELGADAVSRKLADIDTARLVVSRTAWSHNELPSAVFADILHSLDRRPPCCPGS